LKGGLEEDESEDLGGKTDKAQDAKKQKAVLDSM
jgi:hypothetical protein